jgi:hypothetical protein
VNRPKQTSGVSKEVVFLEGARRCVRQRSGPEGWNTFLRFS